MQKKHISFSLKLKIKAYLEYYWREDKNGFQELENGIIKQLSEKLRKDLLTEAN
jgi:hypothetical protein